MSRIIEAMVLASVIVIRKREGLQPNNAPGAITLSLPGLLGVAKLSQVRSFRGLNRADTIAHYKNWP